MTEARGDDVGGDDAGQRNDPADQEERKSATRAGEWDEQHKRNREHLAEQHPSRGPEASGNARRQHRADDTAQAHRGDQSSSDARTQANRADEEDNKDGLHDGFGEVARPGVEGHHPQVGIADDEPKAFAYLGPQRSPLFRLGGSWWFRRANPGQAEGRDGEGEGVAEQTGRCAQELCVRPPSPGPTTSAADSLPCSFALASGRSFLGSREGR